MMENQITPLLHDKVPEIRMSGLQDWDQSSEGAGGV